MCRIFFPILIWFRNVYIPNQQLFQNTCWNCIHFWIRWELGKIFDTKIVEWTPFRYDFFFKMLPKGMKAQQLLVDTPIYGQSVYDFTVALIILINHCNFFYWLRLQQKFPTMGWSSLWKSSSHTFHIFMLQMVFLYIDRFTTYFSKYKSIFSKKIIICSREPNYAVHKWHHYRGSPLSTIFGTWKK